MQQLTPWLQSRFYYKDSIIPLEGGLIDFFFAGTTHSAPTFQTKEGSQNPNPVPLDIIGQAQIWLDESVIYDVYIRDKNGALQETRLGVSASSEGGGGGGLNFVTTANSDTITLEGLGTYANPLTANALISSISSNALGITTSGGGGMYVADLSSAIATLSINKLDKVNPSPQSVVSPVTFNDTITLNSTADETPIKALGRNASNEVVEFTPTDDGENNTSSNVGVGLGLALPKVGVDLPFQSITASGGASVTTNGTEINIDATTTSAGVLSNVYFQAEEVTLTAGTFYEVSESDKGLLSASQDVVVNDNQKAFFAQDFISDPYDNDGIIRAGKYKSELTVEASSGQALKKFTIEVYLCENDGTPKSSGAVGEPIGDLGVQVISIMESASLSLVANDITQLGLSAILGTDVPRSLGERIRFHVSAEKVGVEGAAQTLSLYSGLTADSFVEVPVTITTNDVVDLSSVTSLGNQTSVNNTLNTNKLDKIDATAQSVVSEVDFQGGVEVSGALASGQAIKLPSSAFIGTGANPILGTNLLMDSNNFRVTFDGVEQFRSYLNQFYITHNTVIGGGVDVTGALASGNNIEVPNGGKIGGASHANYVEINPIGVVLGGASSSKLEVISGLVRSTSSSGSTATLSSNFDVVVSSGNSIGLTAGSSGVNVNDNSNGVMFSGGIYEFSNVPTGVPEFSLGQEAVTGNLIKYVDGAVTTPNLQQVTDVGSVTTGGATFGGQVGADVFKSRNTVLNNFFSGGAVQYITKDDINNWAIGVGSNSNDYSILKYDKVTGAYDSAVFRVFHATKLSRFYASLQVDTRILQGGVTDDGTTGIQGTSLKISGNSILSYIESNDSVVVQRGWSDSLLNTFRIGNGLSGASGRAWNIQGGLTNSSLDFYANIGNNVWGKKVSFGNDGTITANIPTGTQVGLVGYDATGKLIQGSASGGSGLKYFSTFNVANIAQGSAFSGSYFAVKIIPTADIAVTTFEYYVTSASSGKTVYCGVYNEAGDTLLGESSGNSDAVGLIETSATTAINLIGGATYWLSILEGSGAPNFGAKQQFADSSLARGAYVSGSPTAMPSSITAGTATTTSAYIGIKA